MRAIDCFSSFYLRVYYLIVFLTFYKNDNHEVHKRIRKTINRNFYLNHGYETQGKP